MRDVGSFVVTGHRGAMALESENTMASFRRAIELGADEIEFDVRRTRDGVLVVHHDEDLGRVTDGAGPLRERTWHEISRLRVHGRHQIPRLDDVLALTGVRFQVEIKDPFAAGAVVDAVHEGPARGDDVLITSFHPAALEPALAGPLRTGLICGPGDTDALRLARHLEVDQILAHWSIVEHADARLFTGGGGALSVWPSPDAASSRKAIDAGYAGTTSDDPRVALVARDLVFA